MIEKLRRGRSGSGRDLKVKMANGGAVVDLRVRATRGTEECLGRRGI